jgi:hypothetical protein
MRMSWDKGADCMIACHDAQKQARVPLLQPLGVVADKRTFFVDCVHHGPSQREQRRLVFDGARSAKFSIGYWSKGCTNAPGAIF